MDSGGWWCLFFFFFFSFFSSLRALSRNLTAMSAAVNKRDGSARHQQISLLKWPHDGCFCRPLGLAHSGRVCEAAPRRCCRRACLVGRRWADSTTPADGAREQKWHEPFDRYERWPDDPTEVKPAGAVVSACVCHPPPARASAATSLSAIPGAHFRFTRRNCSMSWEFVNMQRHDWRDARMPRQLLRADVPHGWAAVAALVCLCFSLCRRTFAPPRSQCSLT